MKSSSDCSAEKDVNRNNNTEQRQSQTKNFERLLAR
jgi:hypothetical protein